MKTAIEVLDEFRKPIDSYHEKLKKIGLYEEQQKEGDIYRHADRLERALRLRVEWLESRLEIAKRRDDHLTVNDLKLYLSQITAILNGE